MSQSSQTTNVLVQKQTHQLQSLRQFLSSDVPLMLVIGEEGSGKTSLLSQLISDVQVSTRVVRLQGEKHLQPSDLTELLSHHWNIAIHDLHTSFRDRLDQILKELHLKNETCLLIADEAHLLPISTLAALSHLAIKQDNEEVPLHLLLLGEPALLRKASTLQSKKIPHIVIEPLTRKETYFYIRYYLGQLNHESIGCFSPSQEVVEEIYEKSGGLPAAINKLTQEWLEHHVLKPKETIVEHTESHDIRILQTDGHGMLAKLSNTTFLKSYALGGLAVLTLGMWFLEHHVMQKVAPIKSPIVAKAEEPNLTKPVTQIANAAATVSAIQETKSLLTKNNSPEDDAQALKVAVNEIAKTPAVNTINNNQLFTINKTPPPIQHNFAGPIDQSQNQIINASGNYSIQLMAAQDLSTLQQFIHHYHLSHQAEILEATRNNANWYVAMYGHYKTKEQAEKALEDMSPQLKSMHPWIREVKLNS